MRAAQWFLCKEQPCLSAEMPVDSALRRVKGHPWIRCQRILASHPRGRRTLSSSWGSGELPHCCTPLLSWLQWCRKPQALSLHWRFSDGDIVRDSAFYAAMLSNISICLCGLWMHQYAPPLSSKGTKKALKCVALPNALCNKPGCCAVLILFSKRNYQQQCCVLPLSCHYMAAFEIAKWKIHWNALYFFFHYKACRSFQHC